MDCAKERHAQLGVLILRLFPTIVQLILKDNITPGKLKRMFLEKTLNTALTDTDIGLMKMLPNMDDFTIEICYKILRFENLIGEPKCKWGNIPHETEIAIADDIQRILNASNEVITKTSEEITKSFSDSFDNTVKSIIGRVDTYLNGNTCQQSYQHLHILQIPVSELLEILEEIIQKHPIKVIPSVMTTVVKTIMRELYSRTAIVITDIFPDILRDILQSMISPQDLYKKCDTTFLSFCFPEQQTYLKTLKLKNSFSFLDIPIIYKLLRHFSLIPPPSKGWGNAPDPTDCLIADDVERIRILRNEIAHRFDANIDKNTCDAFFVRFREIGERIDIYFTGQTNYEQKVIDCRMCPMDIQMLTNYENAVKELENIKLHYKRKPVNFYWGDTFEKNLRNLQTMFKHEKLEGNEKFRVQIVLQTESDMNDRTVSILNSLKDEINQGLKGIDFVVASSGSIVLCVDILIEEMQTDEKMQLVLYSFINKIIETKNIAVFSAGYLDIVLTYSDENTIFEITKKETITSSAVNIDFDIDACRFETDETMKAALVDIVENVLKKSNGSRTEGKIKATVMPLEFDFEAEIVSEFKEYGISTQDGGDTVDRKRAEKAVTALFKTEDKTSFQTFFSETDSGTSSDSTTEWESDTDEEPLIIDVTEEYIRTGQTESEKKTDTRYDPEHFEEEKKYEKMKQITNLDIYAIERDNNLQEAKITNLDIYAKERDNYLQVAKVHEIRRVEQSIAIILDKFAETQQMKIKRDAKREAAKKMSATVSSVAVPTCTGLFGAFIGQIVCPIPLVGNVIGGAVGSVVGSLVERAGGLAVFGKRYDNVKNK